MKWYTFFLLMAFGSLVVHVNGQSTTTEERSSLVTGSSLTVSAGVLVLPNGVGATTAVSTNVRILTQCDRRNEKRPLWCRFLELELTRLLRHGDPWKNIPPIVVLPPRPTPGPDPDPWSNFRLSEIDVGASTMFTSILGGDILLSNRLNLSLFVGGGFKVTEGITTELSTGSFRTFNSTDPVITYGAALQIGLTGSLYAKAGIRGLTLFEGEMEVQGPDGSIATFEGESMTAPMINLGLGYSF